MALPGIALSGVESAVVANARVRGVDSSDLFDVGSDSLSDALSKEELGANAADLAASLDLTASREGPSKEPVTMGL